MNPKGLEHFALQIYEKCDVKAAQMLKGANDDKLYIY